MGAPRQMVIPAGGSNEATHVYAYRILQLPAGCTVQLDNGETRALYALGAFPGPFDRLVFTNPGGAGGGALVLEIAHTESVAAALLQAGSPTGTGLYEFQGRDAGNTLRTPLVDASRRIVNTPEQQTPTIIQAWRQAARAFGGGEAVGQSIWFKADGSIQVGGAAPAVDQQFIDVAAYRMVRVSAFFGAFPASSAAGTLRVLPATNFPLSGWSAQMTAGTENVIATQAAASSMAGLFAFGPTLPFTTAGNVNVRGMPPPARLQIIYLAIPAGSTSLPQLELVLEGFKW